MCSREMLDDAADDRSLITAPASAFGVPGFCALLSQLKCTTALADGRKKRREYLRKYSASERGRAVIAAYEKRNRAKRKAYARLRQALKMGDIVRPAQCENCGASGRPEGHHDDYAKPLEVRWLCRACHKTWHRKNGKALNG